MICLKKNTHTIKLTLKTSLKYSLSKKLTKYANVFSCYKKQWHTKYTCKECL